MEKAILLNHKTIHPRLPLEMNHNILYHCRKVPYTGENRWESVIQATGKKIRVLPIGEEPMTFWSLVQMLYH